MNDGADIIAPADGEADGNAEQPAGRMRGEWRASLGQELAKLIAWCERATEYAKVERGYLHLTALSLITRDANSLLTALRSDATRDAIADGAASIRGALDRADGWGVGIAEAEPIAAEIASLATYAPHFLPPKPPQPPIRPRELRYRIDAIAAGGAPPQRFLLDGLIPLGTAGVVFGPGGVGKSLAALDLCIGVARAAVDPSGARATVFGRCIPAGAAGAAITVNMEDGAAEVARRIAALDPGNGRAAAPCFALTAQNEPELDRTLITSDASGPYLTEFAERGLPRLIEGFARVSGHPVRLVVLDPAGDFLRGPENDAETIKPLMSRLRDIAAKFDCTIALVGHTAKDIDRNAPTMRGSSAWLANSRFAIAVTPADAKADAKFAKQAGIALRDLVWVTLAKANHAGAPIGEARPFRRCPDTGRLLPIGAATADAPLAALVAACIARAEAGQAFTMTKARGLYERRNELPDAVASLSRARLRTLAEDAIKRGLLTKAPDGSLIAPGSGSEVPPEPETGGTRKRAASSRGCAGSVETGSEKPEPTKVPFKYTRFRGSVAPPLRERASRNRRSPVSGAERADQ